MKTYSFKTSLSAFLQGVICVLLCATSSGFAKDSTPEKTGDSDAVVVPKSDFSIPTRAGDGRDPFFPLSRRLVLDTNPTKTNDTVKSAPVSLTLKGISHTGQASFALINDKTFGVGEERDVAFGSAKIRVHCIEIREDSVLINVNGSRQELRLRPGL